jgi:hypothetical protein
VIFLRFQSRLWPVVIETFHLALFKFPTCVLTTCLYIYLLITNIYYLTFSLRFYALIPTTVTSLVASEIPILDKWHTLRILPLLLP